MYQSAFAKYKGAQNKYSKIKEELRNFTKNDLDKVTENPKLYL